jgi:acyl-CoA dehydrogenase
MDILGGAGICLGPRNIMGRAYQALPISITVEGANILTRSMIIFGQGAIRSHPYIFAELEAVAEADYGLALKKFDRALFGHIFFFIRNLVRTFYLSLTGARLRLVPGKRPLRRYFQKLSRLSSAFALLTDTALLTFGGTLKRKEFISGRLSDMLSHLYLASATCRRFEQQGSPKEDIALLRWSCEYSLYNIQNAMHEMLVNFPNRPIAWLLRLIIFPWGRRFHKPSDRLCTEIAEFLMMPSSGRDRLTEGLYLPTSTEQQLGRLEFALTRAIQAEHVERKLRKSLKTKSLGCAGLEGIIKMGLENAIINTADAQLLREAEAARLDAIQVDDFKPDFGKETKSD